MKPAGQEFERRSDLSPLLSSPLLSEQESKSKSHATHALASPPFIFIEWRRPGNFVQISKTWRRVFIPPAIFYNFERMEMYHSRKGDEGCLGGDVEVAGKKNVSH
jgi:hypothetical protein